jgi:hypothetical protein
VRWLLTGLAWLAASALLAPVCFFGVIFLAGPHSDLTPEAFAPVVALLGLAVLLAVPVLAARAVWRRLAPPAP